MKKIVLAFLVISFSVMSFAHAGILAERAQKIADQQQYALLHLSI